MQVIAVLHLKEILLKLWTKDARDILPQHLIQYQKDHSVNMFSFASIQHHT